MVSVYQAVGIHRLVSVCILSLVPTPVGKQRIRPWNWLLYHYHTRFSGFGHIVNISIHISITVGKSSLSFFCTILIKGVTELFTCFYLFKDAKRLLILSKHVFTSYQCKLDEEEDLQHGNQGSQNGLTEAHIVRAHVQFVRQVIYRDPLVYQATTAQHW